MGFLLLDERQFTAEGCRLQVGDRHTVELLDLGGIADLVVTFDDVDVVAMGGDFRETDPAFLGLVERIAHSTPFLRLRLVGEQLRGALFVIGPFALDGHPERKVVAFADGGDAFQAEAGLAGEEFDGEADLRLDLTLGVDIVDAVADELGRITF